MLRMMVFLVCGLLGACSFAPSTMHSHVPVYEINTTSALPRNGLHRVSADETLYSIAWRYGFDYRALAQWNHIAPPYRIKAGQMIYLRPRGALAHPAVKKITVPAKPQATVTRTVVRPGKEHLQKTAAKPHIIMAERRGNAQTVHLARMGNWLWPAQGKVYGSFSSINKGINIVGAQGSPILATAAGKIVYSGNGLRGYGNLIIIKHNSVYLTAYAHNSRLIVKEGEWVKAGQKIAEMGNTGTHTVMLHFEIRRNGKPINPLLYLTRPV